MNINEAIEIIGILQFNYPDTFQNMTDMAYKTYVRQWHSFFERDDAEIVKAAVTSYIQTSTERFMPNVGMIREQIRKLTEPDGISEAEAWGLVKNALRNGLYGYHEEYEKLPPAVRRCVGSENTLREWAMMETEELDSVVASNFQRSFRAISKSEAEWAKLPPGFREEMRKLSGQIFGRLDGDTAGRLPALQGGSYVK